MNDVIGRVFSFGSEVYAGSSELYGKLAREGQNPKVLMVSCADSRVVPEHIMQAEPGDLFVCRNAGNIVPPFSTQNGGVTSTVEYAVAVLGVSDIVICGHSDCGAMKAVAHPEVLGKLPNVAAWLRHSASAHDVVDSCYPEMEDGDRVRAISLENVVSQLQHLRTHPSVAAAIARGEMTLHGWFVDIHSGQVLGLNGETGRFEMLQADKPLPVALPAAQRMAADFTFAEAAE